MRRPLIAGNWKMNGTAAAAARLAGGLAEQWPGAAAARQVDLLVCPPFTALQLVCQALLGSGIELGAQDVHPEDGGAFTGEISAAMLTSSGCRYVILGHSERRTLLGETDQLVARKVRQALDHGLQPVVCTGETLDQRQAGQTDEVVRGQVEAVMDVVAEDELTRLTVAYEPLWAIGTGQAASPQEANQVMAGIRSLVASRSETAATAMRILYGGSVKPHNAAEFLEQADIDGALVGGASLTAHDFLGIAAAAAAAAGAA